MKTENDFYQNKGMGSLFDGEAHARKKDPNTSHEAAENTKGKIANRLETEILSALKRNPHGLTNHEIVAATGIDWNTATPRIAPLVRKNLVVDIGERRIGPTNRPGIVWKAKNQ